MGLLSKAAVQSPVLDEMGKVLRDRILRLPRTDNSPETALNLLKAYIPFHTALCLSLSEDNYESYASSGAAARPVKIPVKKIFSPERDADFFSVEGEACFSDQGIGGRVWIFPLDSEKPWRRLFLLSEDGKSEFSVQAAAAMLAEIGETLIPPDGPALKAKAPGNEAPETNPRVSAAGGGESIQTFLEKFAGNYKTFHGIVLNAGNGKSGKKNLSALASEMVSRIGAAAALPDGNCLILASEDVDRELLAHRLGKSIKTKVLLQFSADSAGGALEELKSCL
jgi:hypothetical protein